MRETGDHIKCLSFDVLCFQTILKLILKGCIDIPVYNGYIEVEIALLYGNNNYQSHVSVLNASRKLKRGKATACIVILLIMIALTGKIMASSHLSSLTGHPFQDL